MACLGCLRRLAHPRQGLAEEEGGDDAGGLGGEVGPGEQAHGLHPHPDGVVVVHQRAVDARQEGRRRDEGQLVADDQPREDVVEKLRVIAGGCGDLNGAGEENGLDDGVGGDGPLE